MDFAVLGVLVRGEVGILKRIFFAHVGGWMGLGIWDFRWHLFWGIGFFGFLRVLGTQAGLEGCVAFIVSMFVSYI